MICLAYIYCLYIHCMLYLKSSVLMSFYWWRSMTLTKWSGFVKIVILFLTVPAYILRENVDTEPRVILNRTLVLNCPVGGSPNPSILWYKEGIPLDLNNNPLIDVLSEGRQLRVPNAQLSDSGTFTCEALNKAGRDSQDYNVQIQSAYTMYIYNIHTIRGCKQSGPWQSRLQCKNTEYLNNVDIQYSKRL